MQKSASWKYTYFSNSFMKTIYVIDRKYSLKEKKNQEKNFINRFKYLNNKC